MRGDRTLRGDVDWELSSMVECLPCILETWAPAKGRKWEKELAEGSQVIRGTALRREYGRHHRLVLG